MSNHLSRVGKSKQFVQFALSVILLSLGAGLLWFGSTLPTSTAKAQVGDKTYTSKWTATKLLTLKDDRDPPFINDPYRFTMEIAIGPSEWVVSETPDGAAGASGLPSYQEIWDVPMTSGLPIISGSCCTNNRITDNTSWNYRWLVGLTRADNLNVRSYNFTLASQSTSTFSSNTTASGSVRSGTVYSAGQGAICTDNPNGGGNNRCYYSTGSYGFIEHHAYNEAEGRPVFAGVVMPLYWEVKGRICTDGRAGCIY